MLTSFDIRTHIGSYDAEWSDVGYHAHVTYELSVVLEGCGKIHWPNNEVTMESGQIVLIPSHFPHMFSSVTRVRFGVIHFKHIPPEIMTLLERLNPEENPRFITLSPLDKEQFERLFRECLLMLSNPLKEKTLNITAWMQVLLLYLIERSQADKQALTITKAADYIRGNLQNPVQISTLASLSGLSETSFRKLFEEVYGMPPKQYQQQCRMTEAKFLLNSTDKDIQDIAYQVGFSRLHSFSQWFKGMMGMSPTEWRTFQSKVLSK